MKVRIKPMFRDKYTPLPRLKEWLVMAKDGGECVIKAYDRDAAMTKARQDGIIVKRLLKIGY
jgi:hypothetical protein